MSNDPIQYFAARQELFRALSNYHDAQSRLNQARILFPEDTKDEFDDVLLFTCGTKNAHLCSHEVYQRGVCVDGEITRRNGTVFLEPKLNCYLQDEPNSKLYRRELTQKEVDEHKQQYVIRKDGFYVDRNDHVEAENGKRKFMTYSEESGKVNQEYKSQIQINNLERKMNKKQKI